jgi:hypothetical protein
VFQIVNPGTPVVLQDLVIQGGLAQDNGTPGARPGTSEALGGGILNNGGAITLDNVGGLAQGAGLYAAGGSVTVASSSIASNLATGGDGGFDGSQGSAQGGGFYSSGRPTVTNSTLSDNSTVSNNFGFFGQPGGGGGIYNVADTLTISNSVLSGNSVHLSGVLIYNGGGGGIYNGGGLTVTNSTLSGNSATYGGGIDNVGTLTISNSILSGNSATYSGGGIYNGNGYFGTLMVTNSTLSGNSTTYRFGGGIYNSGQLTISNSTLSGNSANAYGGGIYNSGQLTISNSTLSGNSASGYGGGIDTDSFANPVTLTNVILTANRSNTFAGSYHGGGMFVVSGSPVLHNTLIAGNLRGATGTTRDDVYGALNASGDYNLIGDGTGMTGLGNGVNGNLVGSAAAPIDPRVAPLDNYGGPTETVALLAGSPALNAGNPNQLGVPDQRGVVRRGGVNIGAYQASASTFILDAPAAVAAGVPFDVTATAVDVFGQVAVGYSGTVTFTTTDADPGVVLPADYTFTLDDGGVHRFTDTGLGETTLLTPGDQMLAVTDGVDATITGSAIVTVDSGGSAASHGGSSRLLVAGMTGVDVTLRSVNSNATNGGAEHDRRRALGTAMSGAGTGAPETRTEMATAPSNGHAPVGEQLPSALAALDGFFAGMIGVRDEG